MATAELNSQAEGQRKATALVFERERRHSRNVRLLKFLLPAAALLMTAGLVGNSLLSTVTGGALDLAGVTLEGGRLVMTDPQVGGVNALERPYEMKAARATQEIANGDVIHLEGIDARLPIGVEDWAEIGAEHGVMYKQRNVLEITSPVEVRTTDGMVARMRSATLDMGSGDISSEGAVEIDMEGSQVSADTLVVTEGGKVMVFEHQVKVLIEGRRLTTASTQSGERDVEN